MDLLKIFDFTFHVERFAIKIIFLPTKDLWNFPLWLNFIGISWRSFHVNVNATQHKFTAQLLRIDFGNNKY